MTLQEFANNFKELPLSMNFPSHFPVERYPEGTFEVSPKIIHYHHLSKSSDNQLEEVAIPNISEKIYRFNKSLVKDRKENFSNNFFWDYRYEFDPELGSGIGSREDFLKYKVGIIRQFFSKYDIHSVVDFGCGDLSSIRELSLKSYTGIDLSERVVSKMRVEHPNYDFLVLDIAQEKIHLKRDYDFSICFDTLIHQPNKKSYVTALENILNNTAKAGLINGFDAEPSYKSEIIFFHESLGKTLASFPKIEAILVGSYRQTSIYQWRKIS